MAYKPIGDFLDATLPMEALEKIAYWKKAFADPNDGISEEQAHAGAEAVRNAYGYSGGADGSSYIATNITIPSVQSIQTNIIKEEAPKETIANSGFGNIDSEISGRVNSTVQAFNSVDSQTVNDGVAVAGGIAIIAGIFILLRGVFK